MHLSGWIGRQKARERYVFTLQAMELCRLESEKAKPSPPPALARAFWRLQHSPGKIYRKSLRSLLVEALIPLTNLCVPWHQSISGDWSPYLLDRFRAFTMQQLSNITQETCMKIRN
jgi:hypothetical protein